MTYNNKSTCPRCAAQGNDNSGNNLVEYDDHWHCFACGYHPFKTEATTPGGTLDDTLTELTAPISKDWSPLLGACRALPDRLIEEKTCKAYNYQIVRSGENIVHIAPYYKDGQLIAQHLRGPDKQFKWRGQTGNMELFGQNKWKSGGKRIIITEGEIDCMTVYQVLGGTWPVVSVPNGASSAAKYIKANLEFLGSYNEVVICFDMDKPGQEAARTVASLFPPGKAKIVSLSAKDPNEMLQAGSSKELVSALWEAQIYTPDEIMHVSSVISTMSEHQDEKNVYPYPWDSLTEFTYGQTEGGIYLWTSGTGSGKSTVMRNVALGHIFAGRSVGLIMLEESPDETVDDFVSSMLAKNVKTIRAGRKLNKLRAGLGKSPLDYGEDTLTDEEYQKALLELKTKPIFIYDHLGNNAMQNLMARIEYMVVSLGVKVIFLDHITAAVASQLNLATNDNNNDRLIIDAMMKDLRSLVARTGVIVHIVSQLVKNGKAFEEGARITLQDLRGSGSLSSVPNVVFALERNRQDPDPVKANTTVIRVLKDRVTGRAGIACALQYSLQTTALVEVDFVVDSEGEIQLGGAIQGFKPVPETPSTQIETVTPDTENPF